MSFWWDSDLLGLDLETSGKDPTEARIVTATIIHVFTPSLTNPATNVQELNWICDPGISIPDEAAAIHGYTTERVQVEGRPELEVVSEIWTELSQRWNAATPLVIYNAAYDMTLLYNRSLAYGGLHGLLLDADLPIIDPWIIDKNRDKFRRGSRKLFDVAAHYGVRLTEADAHGSSADAKAAMRIAWKIGKAAFKAHEALGAMTATELHECQKAWAAAQQASLEEYLQRKDPRIQVERGWPVRS